MDHLISRDGTSIAYERSGAGPPLVLIHGTGIDHRQWTSLLPRLRQYFTVYSVDRRGRGQSGDAQPYAIEREFDDVAAVVDAASELVNLFGHSYGAICSLEAALVTTHIRKLGLYEPPIYTTVELPAYPPDLLDEINALLEAGRAEELLLMLNELAQTPTEEMELIRSLPSWKARVQSAHTIPREMIGARDYAFDPTRLKDLDTPTLLMVGSNSPPWYTAAVDALRVAVPHNRVATLSGQQHEAMETAPELFLREVISFFRTP
jgi:pimeloyl-ACP methyl ester carboxylesterase